MADSQAEFSHEIIVVDNNSGDGQFDDFTKRYPQVIFIANPINSGFASACNLAAINAEAQTLLFLNPDTLASLETIKKVNAFCQTHTEYGIVSCLQSAKLSHHIKALPRIYTLFGPLRSLYFLINQKLKRTKSIDSHSVLEPQWVSGSMVMIRKNWFDKVGGWCEDYWMYSEDIDLSKQVSSHGGKIAILTDLSIEHSHGGASRKNLKTAAITKTEVLISQHVYISRNLRGLECILCHGALIINNLLFKGLFAILGIPFFFIPKLKLQQHIFWNLIKYYFNSLKTRQWRSKRSIRYIGK